LPSISFEVANCRIDLRQCYSDGVHESGFEFPVFGFWFSVFFSSVTFRPQDYGRSKNTKREPETKIRNLLSTHFHRINYADHCRVDWAFFTSESHSGRAALDDQYDFVNSRTNRIDRNQMSLFVLAIHANEARHQ
jgi:hypothetical protein